MERVDNGKVRDDWKEAIEEQGLTYWPTELPDGTIRSYWREGPYYAFSLAEIDQIIVDAKTLFDMFIEAGDYILAHPEIMDKMCIPNWVRNQIKQGWDRRETNGEPIDWGSVYGRIDVRYGGDSLLDTTSNDQQDRADDTLGRIRLYEFNADTPTSLLESAIIQWMWHEDTKQGDDQWNEIYESLVEAWKRNLGFVEQELGHKPVVYFVHTAYDNLVPEHAHLEPDINPNECSYEDLQNIRVLMEACKQAGYDTELRYIQEVHLGEDKRFYDGRDEGADKRHIDVVFKLYPWEFMVLEEDEAAYGLAAMEDTKNFGQFVYERNNAGEYVRRLDAKNKYLLRRDANGTYTGGTLWIEPPYKMLWSNKGLLAVLWELFGSDDQKSKLLIPAYFEGEQPKDMVSYIRKPLLGREGASAEIWVDGECLVRTPGDYGAEGYVIQAYAPPPNFPAYNEEGKAEDNYPVLGIWYIDGEPSGLGIRENSTEITDNLSYFAPHVIRN